MIQLQGLMKSQVLAGSGLLWDQDHIMAIIRGSSFFATLHWVSRGALCNQTSGKLSWKSFSSRSVLSCSRMIRNRQCSGHPCPTDTIVLSECSF